MAHQKTIRCAIALSVSLLLAGCFGGGRPGQPTASGNGTVYQDASCQWSPGSCIYKGSYEPGERAYAEDEARRLNQAQLIRLRRSGG